MVESGGCEAAEAASKPTGAGTQGTVSSLLRVAEEMERQETRLISEDALQQLIREDASIRWLEKFELGGRSLLNRNSDRAFRFSHYILQEFLLAWGIVNEKLNELEQIRATDQLVYFIVLAQHFGQGRPHVKISAILDFSFFNDRDQRGS